MRSTMPGRWYGTRVKVDATSPLLISFYVQHHREYMETLCMLAFNPAEIKKT